MRSHRLRLAVWHEVGALLAQPERLRQEFQRRQHASGESQRQEMSALEAQVSKLRQGLSRLIDSYTEGLIDKTEFEPRVPRLRQRIAHIEEQCEALAGEETLERELHFIVNRLDDFAAQMGRPLDELEWAKKREIIRALVRRVEIGLEHVHVVFRVDSFPDELDPEKKACNFVGGVPPPRRHESACHPVWSQFRLGTVLKKTQMGSKGSKRPLRHRSYRSHRS
jgi:site-specific DNA recombinase